MNKRKYYKLGDIVNFQNGFAFKSSDFRYDGKYKIIRIKELKNGSVKFFEDTVSVSDEPNKAMSKFLVNKGDVIFALTGDPVSKSNPNSWVGRVSLYTHNESAYLNQRTCKITQRGDVIPQYVFYYFRHYDNFYSLASKATGSASQANISTKTLEDTEIILPSLEVQTKIVNILSSLDEKIETNRKINARLEELAQAIFKSWFIDFEPFGGKMPADWETKSIDEVYKIKYGRGLSKSELLANGFPVYGANGIMGYTNMRNVNKIVTLITSRGNGSGDLSYTKHEEAFITNNSFVVEPQDDYSYIDNSYIYQSFLRINFKSLCSGSAQPQLTNSSISSLFIQLPTKDLILRFSQAVSPFYRKIIALYHESVRLAALRDTLLPKLMSGELIP